MKKPYNKESGKRVPLEVVVEMIGNSNDYHYAIVVEDVDEELITIARNAGVDITGYKHVIETSGTIHSQNRHGEKSNDRMPLVKEDYSKRPVVIIWN